MRTTFMLGMAALLLATPHAAAAQPPCPRPVAVIESVRNSVQVVRASSQTPVRASRQVPVCAGDTIQVDDNSRAVLVMVASNTAVAIDQNSAFVITESPGGTDSLIDLLRGALFFITRARRGLSIRTPFVNASVEGTEFVVRVQPDRATITVIEGTVRAANPLGMVLVGAGQQAVAVQGQPPQLQLTVRPRDAVQWALYYEPVLPADSLDQLALIPEAARDAAFYVRRASLLLEVGQLDEALSDLQQVQQLDASNGSALVLRTIVAVALDEKQTALETGRLAVGRAPQSAAARVALSYALQASFDLDAARDAVMQAVEIEPANGAAWARLAELRLALDDVGGAAEAAERAASMSPQAARPHTVLGFISLAQMRVSDAGRAFEDAAGLAPDDPLTRLGLGLVKIRRGELAEGRLELEVAAVLDPDSSLIRSYLAKAYFDEKRAPLSHEQLDLAKALDPLDPTPWFYDALEKHAQNRPVEALGDLQRALELNDNRAVYRSRLLLDSDVAVRGAKLGRLYRDLGFEQLALLEGWKSLAVDPANYSAHRLLADNYLVLPRHEIARDSELLQSQLLQPLSFDAIQPRLADNGLVFLDDGGIATSGLNEYSRLFVTDHVRLMADGLVGNQDSAAGNVVLSGIYRRIAFSAGQFHYSSDGARDNHDIRQNIFNGFIQAAVSATTSVQAEFRAGEDRSGDRRMLFDRNDFYPDLRLLGDTRSIRLGVRQTFAPDSVLLGSYVHRTLNSDLDINPQLAIVVEETADFAEARYLHGWRGAHVTGGVSHYVADGSETVTFGPFPPGVSPLETRHTSGYAYATVSFPRAVSLTAGLSGDSFTEGTLERRQANPKAGVSWSITPATTVRAAAFRTLKRTLISSQTIEPTQVAGFNQFFDDPNATNAWRYGVAVDQDAWPGGYVGAEISARELSAPLTALATGERIESEARERSARAYVYSALAPRFALRAEYRLDRISAEGSTVMQLARSTAHRVPLELRIFDRTGAFGRVQAMYVRQHGQFRHIDRNTLFAGRDEFWTVDATAGFRFPNGRLVGALDVRNLFDAQFNFQDVDPGNPAILPGRRVMGRLTVTF